MKKNAFTLIELMAVIVILATLALIVIPAVDRSIKRSNEKAYKVQVSNIEAAAQNWMADALSGKVEGYVISSLPCKNTYVDGSCTDGLIRLPDSGESITITLQDLIDGKYIEKDVKNPKNGNTNFPSTTRIIIKNDNEAYTYNVID